MDKLNTGNVKACFYEFFSAELIETRVSSQCLAKECQSAESERLYLNIFTIAEIK